jgi:hypothetical protein
MFCDEGEKFEFEITRAARLFRQRFDSLRDFVEWSFMSARRRRAVRSHPHGCDCVVTCIESPESEPEIARTSRTLAVGRGSLHECVILLFYIQQYIVMVSVLLVT